MQKLMIQKLIPANAVASFFFYMWNTWNEEECKTVFRNDCYRHFWQKWCSLTEGNTFGAAEKFFSELSEKNRELLVNRAVTIYDGRKKREAETADHELGCLLKELKTNLDAVYETVKQIIVKQGGLIHTQKKDCASICSVEYISFDELAERKIAGLRVVNNDIQIFSEVSSRTCEITVTEEDLTDPEFEGQWDWLRTGDMVLYEPTLMNIAENISQYTR